MTAAERARLRELVDEARRERVAASGKTSRERVTKTAKPRLRVAPLPPDPWEEAERYARKRSVAAAKRVVENGPADSHVAAATERMRAAVCPISGLTDVELEAHLLAAATVAVLARRRPRTPWPR